MRYLPYRVLDVDKCFVVYYIFVNSQQTSIYWSNFKTKEMLHYNSTGQHNFLCLLTHGTGK